jgi:hypothetical protein
MRKCICKVDYFRSLIKNNTYYYTIYINDSFPYNSFPYHVYNHRNDKNPIGTFSKDYFNAIFVDLQKERIKKLKRLSNYNNL